MEYLDKEDYSTLKEIIDDFIGDTMLGNHLFKAIKVHFKGKERTVKNKAEAKAREEMFKKVSAYPNANIKAMSEEADKALLRFNKKLRRKNGTSKSKKKANN